MPFATGYLDDHINTQPGELMGHNSQGGHFVRNDYDVFEDGIEYGCFVKLDTGSIDKLDNSATPTIAGVVVRSPTNVTEDGNVYMNDNTNQPPICEAGIIAIRTKTGETIAVNAQVAASNTADADSGAGVESGGLNAVDVPGWTYIKQLGTDIWQIRKG